MSQVAMAMAAKAKLLMRELKTVKADLAFAKDRCAQLEEENRMLRENREKGDDADDDDLVRNLLLLRPIHFPNILMDGDITFISCVLKNFPCLKVSKKYV